MEPVMSEQTNRPPDLPAETYANLQAGNYELLMETNARRRWKRAIKWTFRCVLLCMVVTAVYAAPAVVDRYQEMRENGH
jgi:hypothetical protein